MNSTVSLNGQCLCGQVQIKLHAVKPEIGVCHCTMCRQWTGGPFMSINAGNNIEITGAESISIFNSSNWAERAFCKLCGTHLYYRLKAKNDYFVLAGLFGADQPLSLDRQIFIDEKPSYYSFAEDTRKYTGAELMALFNSGD